MKNSAFAAFSLAAVMALGACSEEATTEEAAPAEATETEAATEVAEPDYLSTDAVKPSDQTAVEVTDEDKPDAEDAGEAGVPGEDKAL